MLSANDQQQILGLSLFVQDCLDKSLTRGEFSPRTGRAKRRRKRTWSIEVVFIIPGFPLNYFQDDVRGGPACLPVKNYTACSSVFSSQKEGEMPLFGI